MHRLSALQARVSSTHRVHSFPGQDIKLIHIFHRLTKHHIAGTFSRDSEAYINKHYRAHWQPYWAIFGLFGCILIVISSGWPAVYLLSAGETFLTHNQLKPKGYLGADVVGAYSGVSEIFFRSHSAYP
jgi:hypothetical protein